MTENFTTISGWIITLTRAINASGLDAGLLFDKAGINPSWVKDPDRRIDIESFSRLIEYCNKEIPTRDFSTRVGKYFHPGMFHALGYSMMTSSNLDDAFKLIITYQKILTDGCRFEMTDHGSFVSLELKVEKYSMTQRSVMTQEVVESFLAVIIEFTRSLIHEKFDITKVEMGFCASSGLDDSTYLETFFDCPIEFGHSDTRIFFKKSYLYESLAVSNPVINHAHKSVLDDFLRRVERHDLTYLIKQEIYKSLAFGAPSQQEIAKNLGMSIRNMQRKLFEQGTNYKEILEDTRHSLAVSYIKQAHLSCCEISYLLGFSNVGNFNRAFKRWTGKAPGNYRKIYIQTEV
ncbi:AraC family transcriptional regulator [Veronia pacifica]|uniref:HTH araC/xylS-type domain-containing protein n=1 Tax=Veronia pacifica TaxID=1080227 RepID=A0A1C3ER77_9GAMM|nr:AraC family transcriptional regulator [Veronia pacifica]ODA35729.1 hypothetical protein A8L45_03005 [Veronia pacifica]